jgi:phosphopantetheine--protein transferase-like protein
MTAARIDILCCALPDIDATLLTRYETLLSEEELARLHSFRSPSGAKEFLVGRALLRTALAERLNCNPSELQFSKNADGKPSLAFPDSNWQFNLTHSHDWVALALCEGASVGIVIESFQRRHNLKGIAKRFFSTAENARLERCPENEWLDYFFAVWTLKEAHAKALGIGLPKILNCSSIDVDLSGGSIDFILSGAALTASNIFGWLYKMEQQFAISVVIHGDAFLDPDFFYCTPLKILKEMKIEKVAAK